MIPCCCKSREAGGGGFGQELINISPGAPSRSSGRCKKEIIE